MADILRSAPVQINHRAIPLANATETVADNEKRNRAEVDRAFRDADAIILTLLKRVGDLEERVAALETP